MAHVPPSPNRARTKRAERGSSPSRATTVVIKIGTSSIVSNDTSYWNDEADSQSSDVATRGNIISLQATLFH